MDFLVVPVQVAPTISMPLGGVALQLWWKDDRRGKQYGQYAELPLPATFLDLQLCMDRMKLCGKDAEEMLDKQYLLPSEPTT